MTTIYTIYADGSAIYQATNYHYLKDMWNEIVNSPYLVNGVGVYEFKKGEELLFECKGGKV